MAKMKAIANPQANGPSEQAAVTMTWGMGLGSGKVVGLGDRFEWWVGVIGMSEEW